MVIQPVPQSSRRTSAYYKGKTEHVKGHVNVMGVLCAGFCGDRTRFRQISSGATRSASDSETEERRAALGVS
jgi:hypothetical protein